jgi:hypothetical protein
LEPRKESRLQDSMKFAIPRPPTITVDAIVEGEEKQGGMA